MRQLEGRTPRAGIEASALCQIDEEREDGVHTDGRLVISQVRRSLVTKVAEYAVTEAACVFVVEIGWVVASKHDP